MKVIGLLVCALGWFIAVFSVKVYWRSERAWWAFWGLSFSLALRRYRR